MKIPQLARYNGTVERAYEFVKSNIDIKKYDKLHDYIFVYQKVVRIDDFTNKDLFYILNSHSEYFL